MIEARKISFQEAWDSSVVFFVDEGLERVIEAKVEALLETAENHRVSETAEINVADIADFLSQKGNALDVILVTAQPCEGLKANSPGNVPGEQNCVHLQACLQPSQGLAEQLRAFVNFADGGGWLARKRDLERLVEHCHYFINLQHLDMLKAIVLQHVPGKYFT
ncbi:MAG: hypothetical protein WBW48_04310 [Anaerolineae bacterium]